MKSIRDRIREALKQDVASWRTAPEEIRVSNVLKAIAPDGVAWNDFGDWTGIRPVPPEASETPGVKGTIDAVRRMSSPVWPPRTVEPPAEKWAELEARIAELEQTAPRVVQCKACNGSGRTSPAQRAFDKVYVCTGCNGTGVQRV